MRRIERQELTGTREGGTQLCERRAGRDGHREIRRHVRDDAAQSRGAQHHVRRHEIAEVLLRSGATDPDGLFPRVR